MESLRTAGKIAGGVVAARLGLHGVGLLYGDCKKAIGFFKNKEDKTEGKTDAKASTTQEPGASKAS